MAPHRRPAEVQAEIDGLLAAAGDDAALRERLETLTREPGFHGVPSHTWAPILYRRNRILFRPFIVTHLASHTSYKKWRAIDWKGAVAQTMDPWLEEVDRDGDVALFRRLYAWKLGLDRWPRAKAAEGTWRAALLARLRAAPSRAERHQVLLRFELHVSLDEDTALAVYELDPDGARRFVTRHLPLVWGWRGEKRTLWRRLRQAAETAGDTEFALELYRRQVPIDEWRKDLARTCREVLDPRQLVDALEKRHPQGFVPGIGHGLREALELRGREVFPYVARHLTGLWRSFLGRDSYREILSLAEGKGWHDLWAETLRVCGSNREFDDAVLGVLSDVLPEDETARRLVLLAGVSRELNLGAVGLAQVHSLADSTATTLYGRFPALVRGPFKPHVGARWGREYTDLTERALAASDFELLDYLASRAALRWGEKTQVRVAETLSVHYEALLAEPAEFARRAANALGQVPAFSIYNYEALIESNRLARLLFERRSETYLADSGAIRDLLEAPEIHVQALAFRALGRDDPRAREVARAHLDLLEATLLRPLHRRTRRLAFLALANAATDPEGARRIHARARQALDLPDKRYDKEALVGLIGRLLHRWPELRGPRETPVVRRAEVPA